MALELQDTLTWPHGYYSYGINVSSASSAPLSILLNIALTLEVICFDEEVRIANVNYHTGCLTLCE